MSGSSSSRSNPFSNSLNRRQALVGLCTPALLCGVSTAAWAQEPTVAQEKKTRNSGQLVRPDYGTIDTRAKIVLELQGTLRLPDLPKEKQDEKFEVKAESTLDYFEKIAFETDESHALLGAARSYNAAKVKNWIAGSLSEQELRPECRRTQLAEFGDTWQQFCTSEPLTVRETHLLHSPVNSAAIDLLLPTTAAKPSSAWPVSTSDAKKIFNLEAVHTCSLECKIAKVEKGVATISLLGDIEGTVNSVPTSIQVNGSFQAKLSSHGVIVTWLGIALQEDRQESLAEPGFDVTARIRMIRAETPNQVVTTESELRKRIENATDGDWLVGVHSIRGRYEFLTSRNWSVYADTGEEAILKLVDKNSLVAQCNITRLAKLDEGTQLTMEAFQADIKTALGEQFEDYIESSENINSSGLRVMRSIVMGKAEEVPIQWIYNHVSDDTGRRYLFVFTLGGNQVENFAAADVQLTSSFSLLPEPDMEAQPTVAPDPNAPQLSASKPGDAVAK